MSERFGTDDLTMRRFIGATWLPTVVFAALSRLDSWDPGSGLVLRLGPTATALVIVPLAWRWFVLRRGRPRIGRAALAGATSAFLIPTASLLIAGVEFNMRHKGTVDAFGEGMGNGLSAFLVMVWLLIGGPVGAGVGALVALVQRRWSHASPEDSGTSPSKLDGVLGGAMVATLTVPFTGFLAALLLPRPLQPLLPHGATDVNALLIGTWLVLVPIGAAVGARGAKRWRQITGRSTAA